MTEKEKEELLLLEMKIRYAYGLPLWPMALKLLSEAKGS